MRSNSTGNENSSMFFFESFKINCWLFYILAQHNTINQTCDINSQEILMCPNYTFAFKKNLHHFLLSSSFPSIYSLRESRRWRWFMGLAVCTYLSLLHFQPLQLLFRTLAKQSWPRDPMPSSSHASGFLHFPGLDVPCVPKRRTVGSRSLYPLLTACRCVGWVVLLYHSGAKNYFPIYHTI